MKKKYYRVKIGYRNDEFISIDEDELSMALRAQITGKVALCRGGSISGNHIISITPDYQREMGWAEDHHLKGEDYAELGREKIEEYRNSLEEAKYGLHTQLGVSTGQKRLDS